MVVPHRSLLKRSLLVSTIFLSLHSAALVALRLTRGHLMYACFQGLGLGEKRPKSNFARLYSEFCLPNSSLRGALPPPRARLAAEAQLRGRGRRFGGHTSAAVKKRIFEDLKREN